MDFYCETCQAWTPSADNPDDDGNSWCERCGESHGCGGCPTTAAAGAAADFIGPDGAAAPPRIANVQFRFIVDVGVRYDTATGRIVETYDAGGDDESESFAYVVDNGDGEGDTGEWCEYISNVADETSGDEGPVWAAFAAAGEALAEVIGRRGETPVMVATFEYLTGVAEG